MEMSIAIAMPLPMLLGMPIPMALEEDVGAGTGKEKTMETSRFIRATNCGPIMGILAIMVTMASPVVAVDELDGTIKDRTIKRRIVR